MASSFGVYLTSISVPIVKRVFLALGIGVVTFIGLDVVFNQILQSAQSSWGAIPSAVAGMMGLAGIPDAIGIIFGALTTRLSMIQLKQLAQVA